jgi:diguanylate cyclase
MTAAATSFWNPVNGDFEAVDGEPAPLALARRLKRRRQTLALAATSHVINTGLLAIFVAAGTTPLSTVLLFALCASVSVATFTVISETGLSNGWRDHFFAGPYTTVTCGIMLAFIYVAPEVAVVFLCAFFLNANVIAFRATVAHGTLFCVAITGAVIALYLVADLPVKMPSGSTLERLGVLLTFAVTLARIMFINIFASQMRDNLFRRSVQLEAAYKRIEELAELDELTGAHNRRSIMRLLDREIVRARHADGGCTVALIDLDWFKRINDRFGHLVGDEVLRTFAITIFANIRAVDKFGRFGGEEFLLLLPDTSHDQAMRLLDRLRMIVETLDWSAFSTGLSVTISAGVTTLGPDDEAESLLARADSALYAAKESGRNRIAAA